MSNGELRDLAAVLNGIAEGKKWELKMQWENHWRATTGLNCPIQAITDGHEIHLKLTPPAEPNLIEVPLCSDDIKAGDEFLAPCGSRYQWGGITDTYVGLRGLVRTYKELMDQGWKMRSLGETAWRKCSKGVQA